MNDKTNLRSFQLETFFSCFGAVRAHLVIHNVVGAIQHPVRCEFVNCSLRLLCRLSHHFVYFHLFESWTWDYSTTSSNRQKQRHKFNFDSFSSRTFSLFYFVTLAKIMPIVTYVRSELESIAEDFGIDCHSRMENFPTLTVGRMCEKKTHFIIPDASLPNPIKDISHHRSGTQRLTFFFCFFAWWNDRLPKWDEPFRLLCRSFSIRIVRLQ